MKFDVDTIEKLIQRPKPHYKFPVWEQIQGKVVLVTGAGGFIGSHLCMEIAKMEPALLILVEANEFSLYEIHRQLEGAIPILGSYGDHALMLDVLTSYNVEVVFHVGAFKHVPMVERNVLSAVSNNVVGANVLFLACEEAKIKKLVIVSSDKAVRPTNVMGATKRLVEHLAIASFIPDVKVVRFGNVLWSTGSVLPLFHEQLRKHGKVTLTHPEVDRYFMSVQEAVCLILQSIAMPDRGVYVFDMGEPIKIKSMIEQLAKEMGVSAYEIEIVGLRPGEKLHEELTLGDRLVPTDHPEILRAYETSISSVTVSKTMADLDEALSKRDVGAVRLIMQDSIPGYDPMCGIVDDLFLQKYVVLKSKELDDCFWNSSIDIA